MKQDDTNFRNMFYFCEVRASFTFDSSELKPSLVQVLKDETKLEQAELVVTPWEENTTLFPNSSGLKVHVIHPAQGCEGRANTQL